jgi:hypothetical protein
MATLGAGVYVSRIDTDEWEPDREVGGVAHILFEEGGSTVGLWRSDPSSPPRDVETWARFPKELGSPGTRPPPAR